MKKVLRAFLVAVILLNIALTPGTTLATRSEKDLPVRQEQQACCGCGESGEFQGKVKIEELTSSDLRKALSQALDDEGVKLLHRLFVSRAYTPRVSEASGWKIYLEDNPEDSSVTFVNIPFTASPRANPPAYARILFATDGTATWVAGGSFIETTDGSIVADIYDVVDGSLEHYVVERASDGTITNKTTGLHYPT